MVSQLPFLGQDVLHEFHVFQHFLKCFGKWDVDVKLFENIHKPAKLLIQSALPQSLWLRDNRLLVI